MCKGITSSIACACHTKHDLIARFCDLIDRTGSNDCLPMKRVSVFVAANTKQGHCAVHGTQFRAFTTPYVTFMRSITRRWKFSSMKTGAGVQHRQKTGRTNASLYMSRRILSINAVHIFQSYVYDSIKCDSADTCYKSCAIFVFDAINSRRQHNHHIHRSRIFSEMYVRVCVCILLFDAMRHCRT